MADPTTVRREVISFAGVLFMDMNGDGVSDVAVLAAQRADINVGYIYPQASSGFSILSGDNVNAKRELICHNFGCGRPSSLDIPIDINARKWGALASKLEQKLTPENIAFILVFGGGMAALSCTPLAIVVIPLGVTMLGLQSVTIAHYLYAGNLLINEAIVDGDELQLERGIDAWAEGTSELVIMGGTAAVFGLARPIFRNLYSLGKRMPSKPFLAIDDGLTINMQKSVSGEYVAPWEMPVFSLPSSLAVLPKRQGFSPALWMVGIETLMDGATGMRLQLKPTQIGGSDIAITNQTYEIANASGELIGHASAHLQFGQPVLSVTLTREDGVDFATVVKMLAKHFAVSEQQMVAHDISTHNLPLGVITPTSSGGMVAVDRAGLRSPIVGAKPETQKTSEGEGGGKVVALSPKLQPFAALLSDIATRLRRDYSEIVAQAERSLRYIEIPDPKRMADAAAQLIGTSIRRPSNVAPEDEELMSMAVPLFEQWRQEFESPVVAENQNINLDMIRDGLLLLRLLGLDASALEKLVRGAVKFLSAFSQGPSIFGNNYLSGALSSEGALGYAWVDYKSGRLSVDTEGFEKFMGKDMMGLSVLEIMGGQGGEAEALIKKFEGVIAVRVLELNPDNLEIANKAMQALATEHPDDINPGRISFVPHDVRRPWPFPEGSFHRVMMTGASLYAFKPEGVEHVFREALRMLPGRELRSGRIWIDYSGHSNLYPDTVNEHLKILLSVAWKMGVKITRIYRSPDNLAYAFEVVKK